MDRSESAATTTATQNESGGEGGWGPLNLRFGANDIQGRRPYMEDRYRAVLGLKKRAPLSPDLFKKPDATSSPAENSSETESEEEGECVSDGEACAFFAVYDGHGGQLASSFARAYLHQHLAGSENFPQAPQQALDEACSLTDERYALRYEMAGATDGTTACMVLLKGFNLYAANVGDSRAVLCREGKPVLLSFDHKPDKESERQRIEAAGGVVKKGSFFNIPMGPFRVYQGDGQRGGLAVSRALGDTFYKDPKKSKDQWLVSGSPEIVEETLNPNTDEFILLASDGFWDVFSNEDAVTYTKKLLEERHMSPADASAALTKEAFARESLDNITVLVITLGRGSVGGERTKATTTNEEGTGEQQEETEKTKQEQHVVETPQTMEQ
ncbi:hypothetical protein QOT17_016825 [Balamuthia mandrillaris]